MRAKKHSLHLKAAHLIMQGRLRGCAPAWRLGLSLEKKKDELELLPVCEEEQRGRRVSVCRFGPCLAGGTLPSGSH